MGRQELDWLAEQAAAHESIVEIGCFLGRSTRAFADNTPGRIMAIDTWRDADAHPFVGHRSRPDVWLSEDWLFEGFLHNVSDLIPDKLEVRRRKSLAAAQELAAEGKRFDLVFIDAAHDYENVKADILAWRPLLNPDGLLCGHDFTSKHPGVIQAVRELLPNKQLVDTIWYAA